MPRSVYWFQEGLRSRQRIKSLLERSRASLLSPVRRQERSWRLASLTWHDGGSAAPRACVIACFTKRAWLNTRASVTQARRKGALRQASTCEDQVSSHGPAFDLSIAPGGKTFARQARHRAWRTALGLFASRSAKSDDRSTSASPRKWK